MKEYFVFMSDLALAPLQGQNPRGGRIENFDEIEAAQALAENEKNNWDLVFVYRRAIEGQLEKIEQYQNGRKYEVPNT